MGENARDVFYIGCVLGGLILFFAAMLFCAAYQTQTGWERMTGEHLTLLDAFLLDGTIYRATFWEWQKRLGEKVGRTP